MVTGEAADTAGETASPGVRTRKEPSEVHCALGIRLLISKTKRSLRMGTSQGIRPDYAPRGPNRCFGRGTGRGEEKEEEGEEEGEREM